MKIAPNHYAYPVLASFLPDTYESSSFTAQVEAVKEERQWRLHITAQLVNREIAGLIREHKAYYAYHLECAQTGFRMVVPSHEAQTDCVISPKDVRGRLQVCAFIVAERDLEHFTSTDLSESYTGLSFTIKKGSRLAVNDRQIAVDITDDADDLASMPSIFSVIQNQDKAVRQMTVDFENSQKIVVKLPYEDYYLFGGINDNPDYQAAASSLVVIPALVEVLDAIQTSSDADREDFAESCGWYRTIQKAVKDFGYDTENENGRNWDSLKLAQQLIDNPLSDTLKSINRDDTE